MASRHMDHSCDIGGKEGKEAGKERNRRTEGKNKQPNLEENTTKGIKADFWQVLPVREGCNNSMKSIKQEPKDRMIKQQ